MHRSRFSRLMYYVRMNDGYFLEKLAGKADDNLDALEERSRFLPISFVVGLIATISVWILALTFPRTASSIYAGVVNSNLPRFGTFLTVVAMAIPFAPPFLTVFALGNMLQRQHEPEDLGSGFMSGFSYSQQSNQRWLILISAGISGAVNCLLLLGALMVV